MEQPRVAETATEEAASTRIRFWRIYEDWVFLIAAAFSGFLIAYEGISVKGDATQRMRDMTLVMAIPTGLIDGILLALPIALILMFFVRSPRRSIPPLRLLLIVMGAGFFVALGLGFI